MDLLLNNESLNIQIRLKMKKTNNSNIIIALTFITSTVYAIIRYNVFHEVPWSDLPLYVLNKSISLSAVVLFAISRLIKSSSETNSKRTIKDFAVIFAIIHVVVSITILSPNYFGKFYFDSNFSWIGSFTLFSGILAFLLMFLFSSKFFLRKVLNNKSNMRKIVFLFILLSAVHVFVMGFNGWLLPNSWPGGLPPISLLSFLALLIPLFIKER